MVPLLSMQNVHLFFDMKFLIIWTNRFIYEPPMIGIYWNANINTTINWGGRLGERWNCLTLKMRNISFSFHFLAMKSELVVLIHSKGLVHPPKQMVSKAIKYFDTQQLFQIQTIRFWDWNSKYCCLGARGTIKTKSAIMKGMHSSITSGKFVTSQDRLEPQSTWVLEETKPIWLLHILVNDFWHVTWSQGKVWETVLFWDDPAQFTSPASRNILPVIDSGPFGSKFEGFRDSSASLCHISWFVQL